MSPSAAPKSPVVGRPPGGALVTGAGKGLGREVAVRLARRGFALSVTDLDADLATRTAADIVAAVPGAGDRVVGVALDVRDAEAVREAAHDLLARAGSVEVWVNNAGVLVTGPLWTHGTQVHRDVLEVNALGTLHGMVAALEVMRPRGRGHVINIVSLAGLVPVPGQAAYAASKHAVMGLSLSALADLRAAGERDIHVSCVCPDGIWTPMLFDKTDDPSAAMSFSGRLLRPGSVADVVDRLISRPRPVVTIPRWRGALARLFDAMPGLAIRTTPVVIRLARARQRKAARRRSRPAQ